MQTPVPVLLVIFGLPGSGKSEFAKHLEHAITDGGGSCTVLELDDILWSTPSSAPGREGAEGFDYNAWRVAHEKLLRRCRAALQTVAVGRSRRAGGRSVVVAVDNFPLKSQRLRFWKLARDHQVLPKVTEGAAPPCSETQPEPRWTGQDEDSDFSDSEQSCAFGTLFIDTPLDVCLARNSLRNGLSMVPPAVISALAQRLEPGALHRHTAEIPHLVVPGTSPPTEVLAAALSFCDCLSRAGLAAPPPGPSPARNHCDSRESAMHDLDQTLRRLVRKIMDELQHRCETSSAAASLLGAAGKALAKEKKALETVLGLHVAAGGVTESVVAEAERRLRFAVGLV